MKVLPANYLQLHFRKKNIRGRDEITIDGDMYQLFFAIDPAKSMARIAHETRLSPGAVSKSLVRLLHLDLVEIASNTAQSPARADFMKTLRTHYIKAIGPLGTLLFEETVVPSRRGEGGLSSGEASELVRRLAADIPDLQQQIAFKKAMMPHIVE